MRLGGLYALERLGQLAPDHRQTIVDVICAYLRMPYKLPTELLPQNLSSLRGVTLALIGRKADNQRRQELQVRSAAERILSTHLRDSRYPDQRETPPADDRFWEGMRIDLHDATLTHPDFALLHATEAVFARAAFTSEVWFDGATIIDFPSFYGAAFSGNASFSCATFLSEARFEYATFSGDVSFFGSTFTAGARFDGVNFYGETRFDDATFTKDASFTGARARLVTPDGAPKVHVWPRGWDVQPAADGWGYFSKT